MTESNQPPLAAPPGWTEAMQGKVPNEKRKAAAKRAFIVVSLTFFGMFMWLYILYNLGHQKKANNNETQSANTAVPVTPASAPAPAPAQTASMAASPFGMPRGATPETYAAQPNNMMMGAAYQPQQAAMMPVAPSYGEPALAPAMGYSPYPQAGFRETVPAQRGGVTMSAPREFRHAIGVAGLGIEPATPGQRQRTVVSR